MVMTPVMTERVPQVQAAEIGFLGNVYDVTARDKVRSCATLEALYAEPLLHIKRSQLRLFCHVLRMSQQRSSRPAVPKLY